METMSPPLRLYASSEVLKRISPYFETLFHSGFSESEMTTDFTLRVGDDEHENGYDSDRETDGQYRSRHSSTSHPEWSNQSSPPARHIVMRDTAYTTMRALLYYIYTSRLTFAVLSSHSPPFSLKVIPNSGSFGPISCPSFAVLPHSARLQRIINFSQDHPDRALPVSPRSLYKLAHRLEIADLRLQALDNFRSQLKPESVAYELFGEMPGIYEEIRSTLLDYAVANWTAVNPSAAMTEVRRRVKDGQYHYAADISMDLLARLKDA